MILFFFTNDASGKHDYEMLILKCAKRVKKQD